MDGDLQDGDLHYDGHNMVPPHVAECDQALPGRKLQYHIPPHVGMAHVVFAWPRAAG